MAWILLLLVTAGVVGGLLQAVPLTNEYLRRVSGAFVALGFVGLLM